MAGVSISGAMLPYPHSTTDVGNSHQNPFNPPGPTQLGRPPKTVTHNPLASPAMKNIAGLFIATGTGVAMGCPVLVGALISIGVATSWIGGAGLIIAGVGVGLWFVSTCLSNKERPAGQSSAGHIIESIVMGGIGIVYDIVDAIGTRIDSCCCGNNVDDETFLPPPKSGGMPTTFGFDAMPGFEAMPGFGRIGMHPSGPGATEMPPDGSGKLQQPDQNPASTALKWPDGQAKTARD